MAVPERGRYTEIDLVARKYLSQEPNTSGLRAVVENPVMARADTPTASFTGSGSMTSSGSPTTLSRRRGVLSACRPRYETG